MLNMINFTWIYNDIRFGKINTESAVHEICVRILPGAVEVRLYRYNITSGLSRYEEQSSIYIFLVYVGIDNESDESGVLVVA